MDEHARWQELLTEVELELPDKIWSGKLRSMHITYAKPFVERLFYTRGEHRVFLHRIESCRRADALWHPHPWPSIVKVIDTEGGLYTHSVGTRDGPFSIQSSVATPKNPIVYAMLEPRGFHSVCTDLVSWSVMITGPRWGPPDNARHQSVIAHFRMVELLARWQGFYP